MVNIFLFIPNIIGYFRFVLLFISFFVFRTHPFLLFFCYGMSQLLDMFDGMAARKFNQSTNFGAVLDMVCDRASDAVILAMLAFLYPDYSWLFFSDIVLDLVSHWYQMYASVSTGQHHKNSKTNWKLLQIYYTKPVLFTLVAGNQIFFLTAYFYAFKQQLGFSEQMIFINQVAIAISFVLFLIKKLMSVVQLLSASQKVGQADAKRIMQAQKKD